MLKLFVRAAAAAIILSAASGCVIAIGNDAAEDGRQVRLNATEKNSLPIVNSASELPTIETKYASQLSQLGPGTTVDQFRAIFPDARFVERKEQAAPVDAYSVRIDERYRRQGKNYGYVARDEAWFYFRDGKFIKRGAAGQWP